MSAGRLHRALPAGPGVIWGESNVGDYARFPARRIAAGPTRFSFQRPPGGSSVPPVRVIQDGRPVQRDLERFLATSHTTAFLILRGEILLSCAGFWMVRVKSNGTTEGEGVRSGLAWEC